jgi:proteasome lid subunit RPN8/RPN11
MKEDTAQSITPPTRADHLHTIIEHARSSPGEVCGVLVGQRDPLQIEQIVAARNVHEQPQQHYLVDAAALLHADDLVHSTGQEIVGFYHSHPHGAAVPSPHDLRAAWPGYVYIIAGFADDVPYVCAWVVDERQQVRPVPWNPYHHKR